MTEARRLQLMEDLEFYRDAYNDAKQAYRKLMKTGVTEYMIDNRQITKMDADKLWNHVQKLRAQVEALESELGGGGRYGASAVVPLG